MEIVAAEIASQIEFKIEIVKSFLSESISGN